MEFVSPLDMCDEWASSDEDQENEQPAIVKANVTAINQERDSTTIRTTGTVLQEAGVSNGVITPRTNAFSVKVSESTSVAVEPLKNGIKNQPETADKPLVPIYVPPAPSNREEDVFGQEIRCGINFSANIKIPVNVTGEDVPPAISDFAASGLAAALLQNIQKSGYAVPTPIQRHGIAAVLAGRDIMACAQTGSGKTAAYLLGILHRLLADEPRPLDQGRPHVVVVQPTRELALQVFNEARKFARDTFLRTCVMYGGTSTSSQLQQFRKGCHVLVATPGRLLDFLDAGYLDFGRVRFLVLDEADRMLDMGFLPDVQRIMDHSSMVPTGQRQTLMFSATFPTEIQQLAGRMLTRYVFIAVGIVGGACTDVDQTVLPVRFVEKRHRLVQLLEQDDRDGADGQGGGGTMVFVATRRQADFLANYLSEILVMTTSIHGDRYQEQREQALNDFKAGRMRVLICTSVAARGLNIKNVRHVINYDMPNSIDDYVHRIGRTGRIGNRGRATTFFDPDVDGVLAGDLVKCLEQAVQEVPEFLAKLSHCAFQPRSERRNDFGGLDMRRSRANQNRDPIAHEPLENW